MQGMLDKWNSDIIEIRWYVVFFNLFFYGKQFVFVKFQRILPIYIYDIVFYIFADIPHIKN